MEKVWKLEQFGDQTKSILTEAYTELVATMVD